MNDLAGRMQRGLILPDGVKPKEEEKPKPRPMAIAVPSTDMVHANFAQTLAAMSYYCGLIQAPLIFVSQKGSMIPKSRNDLVAESRKYNASHILFIDSDMTFPPQLPALLARHDKDIVGATYARRCEPHDNLVTPLNRQPMEIAQGLVKVDSLPTGCLLIKLEVFDKLQRPYFRFVTIPEGETRGHISGPSMIGEDVYFCESARAAGFDVWLDVDLSHDVTHWGEVGYRLCNPSPETDGKAYERIELDTRAG